MNAILQPHQHFNKVDFKPKDYKDEKTPSFWCAGCGHYGVLTGLLRALAELGVDPNHLVSVSGIGCSSRLPYFVNSYKMHTLHGRAGPVATGVHLARPDLAVVVSGGDGDGFSIGGGHVAHAIRRNIDITYIVMDNQIYGLTKGQLSPTSPRGLKTVTSLYGSFEDPINPLMYVLSYGAPFVAQGTPADLPGLAAMIEEGIRYPGFAFINIQSPCVTYGEEEAQIKAQRERMKTLDSVGHDPKNRLKALDLAQSYGTELYTGVFFRDPKPPPTFESQALQRQKELSATARPRERILDLFLQA